MLVHESACINRSSPRALFTDVSQHQKSVHSSATKPTQPSTLHQMLRRLDSATDRLPGRDGKAAVPLLRSEGGDAAVTPLHTTASPRKHSTPHLRATKSPSVPPQSSKRHGKSPTLALDLHKQAELLEHMSSRLLGDVDMSARLSPRPRPAQPPSTLNPPQPPPAPPAAPRAPQRIASVRSPPVAAANNIPAVASRSQDSCAAAQVQKLPQSPPPLRPLTPSPPSLPAPQVAAAPQPEACRNDDARGYMPEAPHVLRLRSVHTGIDSKEAHGGCIQALRPLRGGPPASFSHHNSGGGAASGGLCSADTTLLTAPTNTLAQTASDAFQTPRTQRLASTASGAGSGSTGRRSLMRRFSCSAPSSVAAAAATASTDAAAGGADGATSPCRNQPEQHVSKEKRRLCV